MLKSVIYDACEFSKAVRLINTAADSYTAMKRMSCNKPRWKTAKPIKRLRVKKKKNNIYKEATMFSKQF